MTLADCGHSPFASISCADISTCEAIMRDKKEQLFAEQLQSERNLIEGCDVRVATDFLESFIARQVSAATALRLLCILSVVQEGLPAKQYRFWCRLFAQSFGHEHVVTFFNLRRLKLLYESTPSALSVSGALDAAFASKKRFREVYKRLNLIPRVVEGSTYDVKNPPDAAFVFGGSFAPLVVPLLDSCILAHTESCKRSDLNACLSIRDYDCWKPCVGQTSVERKLVIVFLIGGVTFAEVSAIRYWARVRGVQVLVMTTGVLNGNRLMQAMMPRQ